MDDSEVVSGAGLPRISRRAAAQPSTIGRPPPCGGERVFALVVDGENGVAS